MGTNKALLPLGGKPLIQHAVTKLSRLCASVKILSNDLALSPFGPLVPDVHPDCGPMSGIEAALLDSNQDWCLILPVDVPFLTTAYLDSWLWGALQKPRGLLRLSMLSVDASPQPTLLLIHRELSRSLTVSLQAGKYKLYPALETAAIDLAAEHHTKLSRVFWNPQYDDYFGPRWKGRPADWRSFIPQDIPNKDRFTNLNTPEDFAEAEKYVSALDT